MRFRFADLTLDVGRHRVARDGQTLHLGKLTYEMLLAFVEAAPNVVTQDQLVQRVWGGRVTTPETVAQRVKLLRTALGEDTSHPRYIEVVRAQGYRLIPPVEPEIESASAIGESATDPAPPPQDARPSRRLHVWLATGAILVAAVVGAIIWYDRHQGVTSPPVDQASAPATIKSIAVLPFADMSEGHDQQYIADGIAEEILDRLANNQGPLRVIGRTSSFSFRDRQAQIPEIASTLKVTHVLEGSVRRSNNRIRITVQLLEGAGATHIWSQTYDRELGELFGVQDEIASAVAAALQVALGDTSPGNRSPISAASQEEFLRAKFFYERRAPGDFERSIANLEAAVARDPHFARAWELLSGAYSQMWWEEGLDPKTWIARQGKAARKAVEADPQLFEARKRLSQYYIDVSRRKDAVEQYKEAVKQNPDDPWLAVFTRAVVQWRPLDQETETRVARQFVQDDPLSPMRRINLALVLFAAGHLDEALTELRRARELNPEPVWDKELEVGRILVALRRYGEAQASFLQLPAEARDYGLALLYHAPGQRSVADAAFSRLKARPGGFTDGPGDYMHGIWLAEAEAIRGWNDESFVTLLRIRDTLPRDQSILVRIWFFQHELRHAPFLKSLHGDKRWAELMAMPIGDSAEEIIENLWPDGRGAEAFARLEPRHIRQS